MLDHPAAYERYDEAEQIYKRLKSGKWSLDELDEEEVGLLAICYPWVIPE